jgi:hypothetical protein
MRLPECHHFYCTNHVTDMCSFTAQPSTHLRAGARLGVHAPARVPPLLLHSNSHRRVFRPAHNPLLMQVPGSECMRLPECHHFYCTACLSASAAATLDGGAVENMRCPEPSCRRLLPPYTVKELLGPEDFARCV